MTVTINTDFGYGDANQSSEHGAQPTLAQALRQAATDLAAVNVRQKALQAALDAHLARAGVHVDGDTVNAITSTAATVIATDILALLNDAVTQYEAHRILTDESVHGVADATNVITATSPATTEAEGIALANDLKAMYEAHRVLTTDSVHGAADTTNTIASSDATDWDSLVTLINEFKNTTGYEAHRILTGGSEHGAADAINVITAADAGAQITAIFAELNEIKADGNLHIAHTGVHPLAGTAEGTTDAVDEATSVALIVALKATLNTHFASTADHLDADTEVIAAASSTEYEDILTLTADVRASYEAHRVKSTVHAKADPNALGTGSEVTVGLVAG